MQILKRTFVAFATVAVAASVAHAQTKPDFTGTWEMNAAKSDFGQVPGAPSKITMTVTQTATSLKFTQVVGTPMGDQSVTQDMTLDGQAKTVNGPDGQPMTNMAKLDSGMVMISTKANRQGMDLSQTSHWTLAPDGKSMTVQQDVTTPMGGMTMKIVFDKK